MNIENNPAHASLAHALALRAAAQANAGQVAPPDGSGDPKTDTPKVNPTDATKAPPVTGVSRNTLSKEVLDQAIRAQEAGAPDVDTDEGVLTDVERRHLQEIANDPAHAARWARFSGTTRSGIFFTLKEIGVDSWQEIETNPEAQWKSNAIHARNERLVEQDLELTKFLYETREAAGVPPAQIYADILKLWAGNSAFNYASDRGASLEEGHTARWIQAKADYLQDLIDRKAGSDSSGDPAVRPDDGLIDLLLTLQKRRADPGYLQGLIDRKAGSDGSGGRLDDDLIDRLLALQKRFAELDRQYDESIAEAKIVLQGQLAAEGMSPEQIRARIEQIEHEYLHDLIGPKAETTASVKGDDGDPGVRPGDDGDGGGGGDGGPVDARAS